MGVPAMRVGDLCIGTCYSHPSPVAFTAVVVQASPNVLNQTGRGNVGCLAISTCGHMFAAVQGAGTVKINGMGAFRVGDQITGPGVGAAVQGSSQVFVGA